MDQRIERKSISIKEGLESCVLDDPANIKTNDNTRQESQESEESLPTSYYADRSDGQQVDSVLDGQVLPVSPTGHQLVDQAANSDYKTNENYKSMLSKRHSASPLPSKKTKLSRHSLMPNESQFDPKSHPKDTPAQNWTPGQRDSTLDSLCHIDVWSQSPGQRSGQVSAPGKQAQQSVPYESPGQRDSTLNSLCLIDVWSQSAGQRSGQVSLPGKQVKQSVPCESAYDNESAQTENTNAHNKNLNLSRGRNSNTKVLCKSAYDTESTQIENAHKEGLIICRGQIPNRKYKTSAAGESNGDSEKEREMHASLNVNMKYDSMCQSTPNPQNSMSREGDSQLPTRHHESNWVEMPLLVPKQEKLDDYTSAECSMNNSVSKDFGAIYSNFRISPSGPHASFETEAVNSTVGIIYNEHLRNDSQNDIYSHSNNNTYAATMSSNFLASTIGSNSNILEGLKNNRRKSKKNLDPQLCVKCGICSQLFNGIRELQCHMTEHDLRRPYRCNYCPRAYGHIKELQVHIDTHNLDLPYICSICEEVFGQAETLSRHLTEGHYSEIQSCELEDETVLENLKQKNAIRHKSDIRDARVTPGSRYLRHSSQREAASSQSTRSNFSNSRNKKTLPWSKKYRFGVARRGRKPKSLTIGTDGEKSRYSICEFCCEVHSDISHHRTAHSQAQLKNCGQCNLNLATRASAVRHFLVRHKRAKLLVCKLCDVFVGSETKYIKHFLVSHAARPVVKHETDWLMDEEDSETDLSFKPSELSVCETCCEVVTKIKRHYRAHTENELLVCGFCDLKLASKGSVARHFSNVHKLRGEIPCRDCPEVFKTEKNYKEHFLKQHPTPKTWKLKVDFELEDSESADMDLSLSLQDLSNISDLLSPDIRRSSLPCVCPFCCGVFPYLKRHQLRHDKDLLTRCGFCQMILATKNSVIRHYNAIHKAQENLNCTKCKRFIGSEEKYLEHYDECFNDGSSWEIMDAAEVEDRGVDGGDVGRKISKSTDLKETEEAGAFSLIHEKSMDETTKRGDRDLDHPYNSESGESDVEDAAIDKIRKSSKPCVCPFCCGVFPYLKQHQFQHDAEVLTKCGFCKLILATKNSVIRHYNAVHRAHKNLGCEKCALFVGSERKYMEHFEKFHPQITEAKDDEEDAMSFDVHIDQAGSEELGDRDLVEASTDLSKALTLKDPKGGDVDESSMNFESLSESSLQANDTNISSSNVEDLRNSPQEGQSSLQRGITTVGNVDVSPQEGRSSLQRGITTVENVEVSAQGQSSLQRELTTAENVKASPQGGQSSSQREITAIEKEAVTNTTDKEEMSKPSIGYMVDNSVQDAKKSGSSPTKDNIMREFEEFIDKMSVCEICCQVHYNLKKHRYEHADLANKCGFCDKNFTTRFQIIQHFKRIHRKLKNLYCPVCRKFLGSEELYKRHYLKLHDSQFLDSIGFDKFPEDDREVSQRRINSSTQTNISSSGKEVTSTEGTNELSFSSQNQSSPCDMDTQNSKEVSHGKEKDVSKVKRRRQKSISDEEPREKSLKPSSRKRDPAKKSKTLYSSLLKTESSENDVVTAASEKSNQAGSASLYTLTVCRICSEVHWNIKVHNRKHVGKQPRCGFCKNVISRKSLESHYKSVHLKRGDLTCQICRKPYFTEEAYMKHFFNEHKNICFESLEDFKKNKRQICEICCELHVDLKGHRNVHPSKVQTVCGFCGISLATRGSLSRHYLTNHKMRQNLNCKFCDTFIGSEDKYIRHYKSEHERQRGLGEVSDLDSDQEPTASYECEFCEKKFATAALLKSHVTSHEEKAIACDVCGHVCYGQTQFAKHQTSEHGIQVPEKCYVCMEFLPSHKKLLAHLSEHRKQMDGSGYTCRFCAKTFRLIHSLVQHVKRFHDSNPKFKYECKTCKKGFDSKSFLKSHARKHSGERPFMCEFCGSGFRVKVSLQMHLNRHTGDRPYKCDQCSKSFKQLSTLQTHQRQHTGSKPYMCQDCGKRFSDRSNFFSHRRSNHKIPPQPKTSASDLASYGVDSAFAGFNPFQKF